MTRQQVFDYAAERYETAPDYPWSDNNAVLRHRGNGKWYGAVLEVGRDKLGLEGEGTVDVLNLKCEPLLIGSLRSQEGFHPAYHMNKEKWMSIRLDGSVPPDVITDLIDLSYELTGEKIRIKRGKK